jgi:hypothetical protein
MSHAERKFTSRDSRSLNESYLILLFFEPQVIVLEVVTLMIIAVSNELDSLVRNEIPSEFGRTYKD